MTYEDYLGLHTVALRKLDRFDQRCKRKSEGIDLDLSLFPRLPSGLFFDEYTSQLHTMDRWLCT